MLLKAENATLSCKFADMHTDVQGNTFHRELRARSTGNIMAKASIGLRKGDMGQQASVHLSVPHAGLLALMLWLMMLALQNLEAETETERDREQTENRHRLSSCLSYTMLWKCDPPKALTIPHGTPPIADAVN